MQWEHRDPRIGFLRPSVAVTFLCGEMLSADQIIRYIKRAHSRALAQPGEYTVRLGGLVACRWEADGQEDYWCLHRVVDIVDAKKINPVTHLPESIGLPTVAQTEDKEKYSVLVQSFEHPAGARGGGDTDGTDFEFCLTTRPLPGRRRATTAASNQVRLQPKIRLDTVRLASVFFWVHHAKVVGKSLFMDEDKLLKVKETFKELLAKDPDVVMDVVIEV
uniref:Uncharacterized protein n=1 Tax=Chromera velia CCMP2878 TaxID=1169474 RepID=A0A0G4HVN0_9ALVE|eukprot:Cvel_32322.t1-p1 / transcript=Cvel_32322.t1 / gene=Cvel_32322 / organism=Chromera_velia_CCMP2878 / gene_product=hypothetical protein / transcript_product=hypothetical protein / location=Cvel_scaffold5003:1354-2007(+) / protein_length=218 / sequence_SO=supercontig / SO=protein_coding / is_pseudo=false